MLVATRSGEASTSSGGLDGSAALRSVRSLQRAQSAPRQLWLDAWSDPVAGLGAFSSCIHTCNLLGDGDWRLVVADAADKKLKVWKGTQRASEHALLESPVALTSFVPDPTPPRVPALAVAGGGHVYIFKALKPFFKFALPPLPASSQEAAAWQQLDAGTLPPSEGVAALAALRDGGAPLSARSSELLAAAAKGGDAVAAAFVAETRGQPLERHSCITCMTTLQQSADEPEGPSCLVLGTEDGRLLVLNVAGTAAQHTLDLGAAPSFISISGAQLGGYRISVATRAGRLHTLRGSGGGGGGGGPPEAVGPPVQLETQAVGLVRIGGAALIGCMSSAVHCYGGKTGGARQYSLPQPAPIQCMQLLAAHTARPVKALLVALANGEVRVYHERSLVYTHTCAAGGAATALAFGRYAREDNTLVAVTRSGGLDIKIMPRTVNLEALVAPGGPPPEQDAALPVPAKTRLYVEQTQRERAAAVDIHRLFQRDLVKARLATARALVKVLTDGQGAASHAAGASLSLSAAVEGLGPRFRLVVSLTNEGEAAVGGLTVALHYDPALYSASRQQLEAPLLVPHIEYTLRADLRCLRPDSSGGEVRLTVVGPHGGSRPVMCALVRMPMSEPEDVI